MRRAARISPRAPFAAIQPFASLLRSVRPRAAKISPFGSVSPVERRFRADPARDVSPTAAAMRAGDTHLNITLSPHFHFLAEAGRSAREGLRQTHVVFAPAPLAGPRGPGLGPGRTHSHRTVARRLWQRLTPAAARSAPTGDPGPILSGPDHQVRRGARLERRVSPVLGIPVAARPVMSAPSFRSTAPVFPGLAVAIPPAGNVTPLPAKAADGAPAAARFRKWPSRITAAELPAPKALQSKIAQHSTVTSEVVRRHLRARTEGAAAGPPARVRERATAPGPAARIAPVPRATGPEAAPRIAEPQAPAPRRFRAPAPEQPQQAPPLASNTAPVPQKPPEIDIATLDRTLWRRFEKRIRIEQERRGRS